MRELGILRRPPRGWTAGTVTALRHHVGQERTSEDAGGVIDLSYTLEVTWEVRLPGREPYTVPDERPCPTWTSASGAGGSGRRWWSVRLARTHGLLDGVALPCHVHPDDPGRIWVDWDGAYAAHEVAWRRKTAADRAIADRHDRFEGVLHRVLDPFGGRTAAEDQAHVDAAVRGHEERLERDRQATAAAASGATLAGVDPADRAVFEALAAELQRIDAVGREASAKIVAVTDTGRTLMRLPVKRLELEVADPDPRPAALELPMQPQLATRYTAGTAVRVKVDPADPAAVAILT